MHWAMYCLTFYVSTCALAFFSIVCVLGATLGATTLGDCSGALIFCAVEHMIVYYTGNKIPLSISSTGAPDLRVGCAML